MTSLIFMKFIIKKNWIKKSIYNFSFFFKFKWWEIIKLQMNKTLILANKNFNSKEEKIIKIAKLIIKICKYFIFR